MPMYLKRDAIRFIEASVSAISMAVAALGMPRRYDFREEAAENAIAIGNKASVETGLNNSENSIAFGNGAKVSANNAMAFGVNSSSSSENGIAIGPWAKVSGYNSVALGLNSEATENEVVSVGNENIQRRIVNVADGINETDAATVGQMNAATEGTVKWDKDTDGNYQEGMLKGVKLSEGTVTAKDITTDTINSGYYNNNYVGARRVM